MAPHDLALLISDGSSLIESPDSRAPATFILTWNPTKWEWTDRAEEIKQISDGGFITGQWSTGNRVKGIHPGDRAFMLEQGSVKGIVGSGYFVSEVFQEPHWDGTSGKTANYALLVWDALVGDDDRLEVDTLRHLAPGVPWDNIQASGLAVSADDAAAIETLWADVEIVYVSPEEEAASALTEGSLSRVEVNRYERNPKARRQCLEHYGVACSVCEMDFEAEFGEIGSGFIHVHHLAELSSIGSEYVVDPIEDLRPVCPNCHAMLHKRTPAFTIEELRALRGGT